MTARNVTQHWQAIATSDGAGVQLKRALGARPELRLDPFLMLDNFSSDNPDDYNAGFPAHPHRGFETVTYIIDGHMKHRDHLGNEGDLKTGGVQWMTAGRGIVHEEMPQQKDGLLRGFQLWLNLPAKDKMQPAHYEDVPAEAMPWLALPNGAQVKLIAGELQENRLTGDANRQTRPVVADITLAANSKETLQLPADLNAMLYVFEGSVRVGGQTLGETRAAILGEGDSLTLETDALETNGLARLLLIAGKPLNEPIAQYGPFVMNTQEEIEQAVNDYRNGTLTN